MMYLIILSVTLGALGQVLVKLGAKNLILNLSSSHILSSLGIIITNIPIMSGIVLYGLSFLIWIKVLTKVDLSVAYPMVSLGYIVVMFFSYFLFKENITVVRIIGVVLIIAGVIFISRS